MTTATADRVSKLVDRIRQAQACTECDGRGWYRRKHAEIKAVAKLRNVPFERAVAAYAVLSANASVLENDRNFVRVMFGHASVGFGDRQRRVELALAGDIAAALNYKNGEKIPCFFDNIYDPEGSKRGTMDRHAGDIVTDDRRETKRILSRAHRAGYREIEDTYIAAAYIVGIQTLEAQEVTWVHHQHGGYDV